MTPFDLGKIVAELDEFEAKVIRCMAGENLLSGWGAAVGEAMGPLKRKGLVAGAYHLTSLGRAVAAKLKETER